VDIPEHICNGKNSMMRHVHFLYRLLVDGAQWRALGKRCVCVTVHKNINPYETAVIQLLILVILTSVMYKKTHKK